MCVEASAVQVNINSIDPASTEQVALNMKKIKELSATIGPDEAVCIKCPTVIDRNIECCLCEDCHRL